MGNPRWATVTPDGLLHEFHTAPTLDAIAQELGGNLELLPAPRSEAGAAWINRKGEDPAGERLPMNPRGTAYLGTVLWPGSRVSGTIALTGPYNEDEVIEDLSENMLASARTFFG